MEIIRKSNGILGSNFIQHFKYNIEQKNLENTLRVQYTVECLKPESAFQALLGNNKATIYFNNRLESASLLDLDFETNSEILLCDITRKYKNEVPKIIEIDAKYTLGKEIEGLSGGAINTKIVIPRISADENILKLKTESFGTKVSITYSSLDKLSKVEYKLNSNKWITINNNKISDELKLGDNYILLRATRVDIPGYIYSNTEKITRKE